MNKLTVFQQCATFAIIAHSRDPDQTAPMEQSDLGLY